MFFKELTKTMVLSEKIMELKLDHQERCYPDSSPRRVKEDHFARYEFAAPFVRGKSVADIGCGEGYGANILKESGAKSVVGIDNDPSVIAHAKETYPNISFAAASAVQTNLPGGSFDVVVSFEVWHHLDDFQSFIPEMERILKPGGIFICSVPNQRIIYLNPFHRQMLTPYYRNDFDKNSILRFLAGRFVVEDWYGQRFVRPFFALAVTRMAMWALASLSRSVNNRITHIYKLANGPRVLPSPTENARIIVFVARRSTQDETLHEA